MWEAILFVVDQKFPQYKEGSAEFWDLPRIQQWGFSEPDDATCTITGCDQKTYKELPRLKVSVENADVQGDEEGWSFQGYLVSVEESSWIEGMARQLCVHQQFVVVGDSVTEFEFRDLSQVTYPKLKEPVQ